MGFWKDVVLDIKEYGISKEKAIDLNAKLKYGTSEERNSAKNFYDSITESYNEFIALYNKSE